MDQLLQNIFKLNPRFELLIVLCLRSRTRGLSGQELRPLQESSQLLHGMTLD